MAGKTALAFALLVSNLLLVPVLAQIYTGYSGMPWKYDRLWQARCQGKGTSGYACFHFTEGKDWDYTVSADRISSAIMSEDGKNLAVACQTDKNPLRVNVAHVGYIDVKGPTKDGGCSIEVQQHGINLQGTAGPGVRTVNFPVQK
ncbi:hypothetical protein BCV70DRAFT_231398 [Testicularia cyperi]|uniref:Uncharacterized protein n=1 Tax=Testicularia cyperi TaxID=1882483 RepID=A0A317XQL4_9BASI|nr:hypothetical protein BCV70DRAFT_231398 [Testicularia cyperi]